MASVLYVTEFYWPHIGGVEFLFQSIAEEMAKNGHRVAVLTAQVPGSARRETHNGVEIYRIPVPRKGSRYFFTFLALFKVLQVGRGYEIFHTTTYNAAVPASLAGFVLRKKVILTVHEVWDRLWYRLPGIGRMAGVLRAFEKAILNLPYTTFVCVSKSTLESLLRFKPSLKGRAQVIYNGIDYGALPEIASVPSRKSAVKTILYYGRPGISKGADFLVKAFNKVTNEGLALRMLVSKDDPIRFGEVEALVENPRISLSGSLPRRELFEAIGEADYVIIPSLAEGFGFSALEACIFGKKVICSNQGALPEVVYGEIAFYSPWKEEELVTLLNSLDDTAFETIPLKKFPIEKTVQEYMALY